MEIENDTNILILPGNRKRKKKDSKLDDQQPAKKLSKNEQKKIKRIEEEKKKREIRDEALKTLEEHKLDDNAYALLHSSGTRGKVSSATASKLPLLLKSRLAFEEALEAETMRERLRRAINMKRAGLEVPSDIPLFQERDIEENTLDNIREDMTS